MAFPDLAAWLEQTPVATAIRESGLWFPTIESVHVIAVVLVVGSVGLVDLRLLSLVSTSRPVRPFTAQILKLTWIAFSVAVITGLLLFSSKATKYLANFYFVGKMILIAAAGINVGLFHHLFGKTLGEVDPHAAPLPARLSAGLSLTLWTAVVVFGRWIGFTVF